MSGFSLLWGKILDSSIWVNETKETRLVWVTMLAMRDKDGKIQAAVVGLADRAKVTPDECRAALKVLLAPDKDDSSGVEQGRRLREIPGGWEIVNHDLYRFSTEEKREFWRRDKAKRREEEKLLSVELEKAKAKSYAKRVKKAVLRGTNAGVNLAIKEGFES